MSVQLAQEHTQEERSLIRVFADRYDLSPKNVLPVLQDTIMPGGKASMEQTQVFLVVCNEYELNPFTKEIYAFPTKGGGIQPVVGVDGWVKLVHKQKDLDGIEFEEHRDDEQIIATTCRIYRKNMARPVEVTEYLSECKRNTEPWQKWPHRMLRHKALIQCARVAFGLGGIVDDDEAERMKEVGAVVVEEMRHNPNPRAQSLRDRLRQTRDEQATKAPDIETTPDEQAEALAAQAELERRREEARRLEAEEAASEEAAPQEREPGADDDADTDAADSSAAAERPDCYDRLCRAYDTHAELVDRCLREVDLPSLPDLVLEDLDATGRNRLRRAASKYTKRISEGN